MTPELIEKLACPNDRTGIIRDGEELRGKNSGVRYPVYNGIPFLYQFPLAAINEWAAKVRVDYLSVKRQVASVDKQSKEQGLSTFAVERLKAFHKGLVQYEKCLKELIEPLEIDLDVSSKAQAALLSGIPTGQKPFGYGTNFFRDWSWGEEENQRSLAAIQKLRIFEDKSKTEGKEWAVLGSGFGRLGYDVHRAFKNSVTVLIDLNPFSILASHQMTTKGEMTWVEFPRIPKDPQNAAIVQRCEAEPVSDSNFFHIVGDATHPPFGQKTFDFVLTPWFIDIVPERLDVIMSEINRILRPGGKWIQLGPLSFEKNLQKDRPSEEEVFEMGEAQGFKMKEHFDEVTPYLASPYAKSYEMKMVTTFCLEKVKDVPRSESLSWSYMPLWLEDLSLPIVKTESLTTQMQFNEIITKLLRLIDGKKSVLDIADDLGDQYKTDKGELVESIRIYLTRLSDANLFRYGNDGSAKL